MRQRITWQQPEHLFLAKAIRGRSELLRLFAWLTALTVASSVLMAIVVQFGTPGLPGHVNQVTWFGTLFITASTVGCYGFLHVVTKNRIRKPEGRSKHAVSSQGISRTGTTWPWKRFAAFDIDSHPEDPESRDIVFFGNRGSRLKLTLPGSERDDVIIGFVAKHLPLVEELPDAEVVKSKPTPFPMWMRWLFGLLNFLYGVVIGYIAFIRIHPDFIDLLLWGVLLINPATIAFTIGECSGWLRRKRMLLGLWLMGFSVLSVLALIVGVILAP